MSGQLDVLSVGKGHMRITITEGNEEEIAVARRMIEDMLKRGYSIFVEREDGTTRRVKKFHADAMEYVIDEPKGGLKPKAREKKVPVSKSKATAVGRSAGG